MTVLGLSKCKHNLAVKEIQESLGMGEKGASQISNSERSRRSGTTLTQVDLGKDCTEDDENAYDAKYT